MSNFPFKLNQDRHHRIPRQRHWVTNWPAYDTRLRQRGSLTVWFSDEAVQAWAAEPRTTRGGQPWYSPLAILTALTLRAVFRLAYRQAEGLLGSVVGLLGLALRVPDHTTVSRRAATLEVPRPSRSGTGGGPDSEPLHLLVDSTGLRLCGAGEWLTEKHSHAHALVVAQVDLGVDANTGRIVASALTGGEADDGAQVGPLFDQVAGHVRRRWRVRPGRHLRRGCPAPPRRSRGRPGALDGGAQRHGRERTDPARPPPPAHRRARAPRVAEAVRVRQALQSRGRDRALEAGDRGMLRSRMDERQATEVEVAVHALNRMLELGRPTSVRIV